MSCFPEVRIVADRLVCTEFGPRHAATVKALVEAGDFTALPPEAPSRPSEVDGWLADGVHRYRRQGAGIHLMMAERSSGELVGAISLFKTDWEARSSEVGYGVRPDRRGRGYASEAVVAVARWALAEGGMQRIQLCAVTDNGPSLRVAQKAGFQREGTLRRAQLEDDGLHDLAVFSLLNDDPGVLSRPKHHCPFRLIVILFSRTLTSGPPSSVLQIGVSGQNRLEHTCRMRADGGIMRTVNTGIMRATRVGAGPAGEPYGRGATVAKAVVVYHCANGHATTVPFIGTATPPPEWECRVCSQPGGTDPLDPPLRVARYIGEKTHLGRVRDRRTQADGDRLMAESLARRDHPEEHNVWARPGRRKA